MQRRLSRQEEGEEKEVGWKCYAQSTTTTDVPAMSASSCAADAIGCTTVFDMISLSFFAAFFPFVLSIAVPSPSFLVLRFLSR